MTAAGGAAGNAPGPTVELVLFDTGGVIAEWTGLPVMRELSGGTSDQEVANRWLMSPWVRRFESGACSEQEFAAGIVTEWGFPFGPQEFMDRFLGWLGDPFDGAEELVRDTGALATVGCLSNTNAFHWRRLISRWPLTDRFTYRLLSFELGAVKPDHELFARAVAQLPVAPDRVLFLDATPLNVEGARAAGLRADLARGITEARGVLSRYLQIAAPAAQQPPATAGRIVTSAPSAT